MFVKIWRGLSLGVHLGADLGWTFAGSDASPYHAFDLETELAWMF